MLAVLLAFIALSPLVRASHVHRPLQHQHPAPSRRNRIWQPGCVFAVHPRIGAAGHGAFSPALSWRSGWRQPSMSRGVARRFWIPRLPCSLPDCCWPRWPGPKRPRLYARLLRMRVLTYFGQISYGLYMSHMLVFIVIGSVDAWLAHSGPMRRGGCRPHPAHCVDAGCHATLVWL